VRIDHLAERLRRRGAAAVVDRLVTAPAPIRTGSVYVSGRAVAGRALHCVAQVSGATTIAFKWTRGGTPITTGSSYRVRRADAGAALACTITPQCRRRRARRIAAVVVGADLGADHRHPTLTRPAILCTQRPREAVLCTDPRHGTDRNGSRRLVLVAADTGRCGGHGPRRTDRHGRRTCRRAARYEVVARAVDEAGNIKQPRGRPTRRSAERRLRLRHGRRSRMPETARPRGSTSCRDEHDDAVDADTEAAGGRIP